MGHSVGMAGRSTVRAGLLGDELLVSMPCVLSAPKNDQADALTAIPTYEVSAYTCRPMVGCVFWMAAVLIPTPLPVSVLRREGRNDVLCP